VIAVHCFAPAIRKTEMKMSHFFQKNPDSSPTIYGIWISEYIKNPDSGRKIVAIYFASPTSKKAISLNADDKVTLSQLD